MDASTGCRHDRTPPPDCWRNASRQPCGCAGGTAQPYRPITYRAAGQHLLRNKPIASPPLTLLYAQTRLKYQSSARQICRWQLAASPSRDAAEVKWGRLAADA